MNSFLCKVAILDSIYHATLVSATKLPMSVIGFRENTMDAGGVINPLRPPVCSAVDYQDLSVTVRMKGIVLVVGPQLQ